MADTTQTVNIELRAIDTASAVVKNISRATGKLLHNVDRITQKFSGILGRYGGIATALSLGASVSSAKSYFDQIKRIKNVAGGTANEIAGVKYMMEKAGVSAADMESTYTNLAKLGGKMNANHRDARKLSRQLGVDFRKGPVSAMVQLADQVKKGKVGYKELDKLGGAGMLRMRNFLRQGGAAVRQQYEEARKKMGVVNDETMMQYSEFKKGVGKIRQAWNRVVVIVGAKLLPILTKMMEGIADRIDGWAEKASMFGEFLVKHMGTVVSLAQTFGKIMMANYLLMKATGKGLGAHMTGLVGQAHEYGKKKSGGKFALAEAAMAGGVRGRAAGGIGKMISKGGVLGRVGIVLGKFFAGVMLLGPIVALLLKLAVVAVFVTAAVKGIKMAITHVKGLKKWVTDVFDAIKARISGIVDNFKSIMKSIFSPEAPVGKFLIAFGTGLVGSFRLIMVVVEKILFFFQVMSKMVAFALKGNVLSYSEAAAGIKRAESSRKFREKETEKYYMRNHQTRIKSAQDLMKRNAQVTKVMQKNWEFEKKFMKARGIKIDPKMASYFENVPEDRPQFYQDFRGSRFDITQKFAEGFDPDRIALAFANDLSNFGERQIQGSLGAPFTVR